MCKLCNKWTNLLINLLNSSEKKGPEVVSYSPRDQMYSGEGSLSVDAGGVMYGPPVTTVTPPPPPDLRINQTI